MTSSRLASRLLSLGLAASSGAVLGTARWLVPSPTGNGTHLQLGLGQCTFLSLTGYPCPMCGMTTTFALMADLHPLDALFTQPFGVVLFLAAVCTFGVAVAELVRPKDRWSRLMFWAAPFEGRLAALFLVGLGAGWLYKIAVMVGLPGSS